MTAPLGSEGVRLHVVRDAIDRSSPCLCNGLVGNAVRDALRAAS